MRRIRKALLCGALTIASVHGQGYNPNAVNEAQRGVSLAAKQKYAEAVQAYRNALKLDSRLPHLYLNLGLAYFKQGQFREALAAFQKEAPTDQTVTLSGMSYFGLGEYRQAAAALHDLAARQPDNSQLGYLLAKCYLWAGESAEAMEMFRKLLERDPDSAPVHMLMAEALDAEQRDTEAMQEFQAALRIAPLTPEAHFGLGYLYWKQKRYPEAESEFKAELASNPNHAPSLAYSGDVMLRQKRLPNAVANLKRAAALDGRLHIVHRDLGIYYQETGNLALAVGEFQQAIKTSPDNYDAHYRLARIYRDLGRTEDARREFAMVQKLHEQANPEPLMRIGGSGNH